MTLKTLLTLAVVAVLSSSISFFLATSSIGDSEEERVAMEMERESMKGRLLDLERQLQERKRTPRRIATLPNVQRSRPVKSVSEVSARVSTSGPRIETTEKFVGDEVSEKKAKVASSKKYLAQLLDANTSMDQKRQLWKDLAKEGLVDDVIDLLAEASKQDPNNPDLATDLGSAYVSKLRGENVTSIERRELTGKAMAQFDRALSLNNEHWEARFSKSMMQVFAPPALGLSVKAKDNLETLIDQQRAAPKKPEHAHTYFFLANIYENRGDKGRASALRQEAAGLFPEDERFQ